MLKYVTKFAMDILPSVVATILGAYIVNHYINAKPAADAPVAAAVSPAEPKMPDAPADVGNLPEAGVKAKGISEKAVFDRAAIERIIEKPPEKPQEKSVDKPAESASIPADTRRHPAPVREKTAVAKAAPVAASVAVLPAVTTPAPAVETAVAPDDRRDANDLARAAIERLRGTSDPAPRPPEAARAQETPRVAPPAVRPLPPPILVSTPPSEAPPPRSPYAARDDDPSRPTPPADIPSARPPLDLRADATDPSRNHTNVAEDVLLAAKSVFHAVLPK